MKVTITFDTENAAFSFYQETIRYLLAQVQKWLENEPETGDWKPLFDPNGNIVGKVTTE